MIQHNLSVYTLLILLMKNVVSKNGSPDEDEKLFRINVNTKN